MANGWQISPVLYLMSGTPFTVNTGSNKNFDSLGQSRPSHREGKGGGEGEEQPFHHAPRRSAARGAK